MGVAMVHMWLRVVLSVCRDILVGWAIGRSAEE